MNPFAKERRAFNFWQVGVIFQGEFDGDAQNAPAFPKRGNHGSITKKSLKTFLRKKCFDFEIFLSKLFRRTLALEAIFFA